MKASRQRSRLRPSVVLLALLTTVIPLSAISQSPARVQVVVSGLRNDKGQVSCALFRSADGFPKDAKKAVAHQEVRIAGAQATCNFEDVPPGQYAVAVFHDENGNGKMDTNFVGMPRGSGRFEESQDSHGTAKIPRCRLHCRQ